jgi:hypothetical protein
MGKSEGATGEDVGCPGPSGEGRYQKPGQSRANSKAKPESPPIKLPNPPDDTQPETPKVGSRDAPGG